MVWLKAIPIQLIWYGLGLCKFQLIWLRAYMGYTNPAYMVWLRAIQIQLIWYGLGLCEFS